MLSCGFQKPCEKQFPSAAIVSRLAKPLRRRSQAQGDCLPSPGKRLGLQHKTLVPHGISWRLRESLTHPSIWAEARVVQSPVRVSCEARSLHKHRVCTL